MPAYVSDLVGQRLGQYTLTRLLAQGEHSTVYLGKHITLGHQAAIRVLQLRLASTAQTNFLTEVETLKKLKHPNMVQILDVGVEDDMSFLVMTYASRGTLHKLYPSGTRLRPLTILSYIKQTAAALDYLHTHQIIHRSVRPEHLLLNTDGTLLLSDSSLSINSQSSRSHDLQDMAGSIIYMAPEQLQGKAVPASDQYALGVVAYEWLSGAPPFQGSFTEVARQQVFLPPPSLQDQLPELHPALNEVILIALSKDPKQRFAHLQAFAYAFEQACQAKQPLLEGRTFSVPDLDALLPARKIETSDEKLTTNKAVQATEEKPVIDKTTQTAEEKHEQRLPAVVSQPQSLQVSSVSSQQHLPASQQTTSTAQQRPYKHILLLSILAVLVILSGSSLFYLISRPPAQFSGLPQSPDEVATTLARDRATTVAGSYARDEATAEALGNTAATATAAARNALYQQATQGTPKIDDPLQRNTNNRWYEQPLNSGEACTFKDGTYHAIVALKNTEFGCPSRITDLSNIAIQVQMTILKGDLGGIDFYVDSAYRNMCSFYLSSNGAYFLACGVDNIVPFYLGNTQSSIKKSPETNLITIIARKGVVSIYVNASYLLSFSENQLTTGSIILTARDNTNDTDVSFSQLKVWQL